MATEAGKLFIPFNIFPRYLLFYFVLYNYVARSADSTLNTFGCPFADRCSCRVKFRIAATAFQIKLEGQGEHTAESHVQDKVAKFLTIQQSSALEQMVSTNPKKPHLKDKILQCAAHLTGYCMAEEIAYKVF